MGYRKAACGVCFGGLCDLTATLIPIPSPCAETLVSYMYGQNHVLFVRYEGAALGVQQLQ